MSPSDLFLQKSSGCSTYIGYLFKEKVMSCKNLNRLGFIILTTNVSLLTFIDIRWSLPAVCYKINDKGC